MRIPALVIIGALAACTSSVTVPNDTVLYEVPPAGTASTAGGADSFTATIESSLAEGGNTATAPLPQSGTPLDDDRLNLMEFTLEQQKIDAAVAERDLAEARSRLVVVPPTSVPSEVQGVNIALYAQQTTNAVGERRYDRRGAGRLSSSCGRYRSDRRRAARVPRRGRSADGQPRPRSRWRRFCLQVGSGSLSPAQDLIRALR